MSSNPTGSDAALQALLANQAALMQALQGMREEFAPLTALKDRIDALEAAIHAPRASSASTAGLTLRAAQDRQSVQVNFGPVHIGNAYGNITFDRVMSKARADVTNVPPAALHVAADKDAAVVVLVDPPADVSISQQDLDAMQPSDAVHALVHTIILRSGLYRWQDIAEKFGKSTNFGTGEAFRKAIQAQLERLGGCSSLLLRKVLGDPKSAKEFGTIVRNGWNNNMLKRPTVSEENVADPISQKVTDVAQTPAVTTSRQYWEDTMVKVDSPCFLAAERQRTYFNEHPLQVTAELLQKFSIAAKSGPVQIANKVIAYGLTLRNLSVQPGDENSPAGHLRQRIATSGIPCIVRKALCMKHAVLAFFLSFHVRPLFGVRLEALMRLPSQIAVGFVCSYLLGNKYVLEGSAMQTFQATVAAVPVLSEAICAHSVTEKITAQIRAFLDKVLAPKRSKAFCTSFMMQENSFLHCGLRMFSVRLRQLAKDNAGTDCAARMLESYLKFDLHDVASRNVLFAEFGFNQDEFPTNDGLFMSLACITTLSTLQRRSIVVPSEVDELLGRFRGSSSNSPRLAQREDMHMTAALFAIYLSVADLDMCHEILYCSPGAEDAAQVQNVYRLIQSIGGLEGLRASLSVNTNPHARGCMMCPKLS